MQNDYQTTKSIAHNRRQFSQFMRKLKLNRADLGFIAVCLVATIYLTLVQPLFVSVFSCATLLFFALWQIARTVPILEKLFGCKIRFWHLATAVITVTALLNNFQTPAQAVFLSGLEQFMTNLATEAGAAGGGTAVDASTIALIFNAIRGVFLLLVAAAALFAYNQAQQGNDWRPIVTQIALAFGIVIAIDVVTFLFVGNGTGGTAQLIRSVPPLGVGTILTFLK
ncbi:MAG TPA: hypothetical protein DDW76_14955 [Cyanobacteria bacterium UBA11369]|nr:hypothetical protein [Cyanobacteria bacterium UBA11371]HBE16289.1 hypothetical protein [Cyanobacteria bacterium UBA11367]HBE36125.1 hypothetical protein [Cyanobacteria bacterium UBA11368]HBE50057.1 hypothetical protein [Cyanobacteria bacterium UBA11369]